MLKTAVFAGGASLPLLFGALVGVRWRPPRHLVATALAYAAGRAGSRYCAGDTLDMLKSGTRRAGVAVREK